MISRSDLLWWLGALHTDCYIWEKDNDIKELRLRVGKQSYEMLVKWKSVLEKMTGKSHIIKKSTYLDKRSKKSNSYFEVRISSSILLKKVLQVLPTKSFKFDSNFVEWIKTMSLGPYLAGIIDGDGCIQIRKRYFDSGYERLIKIADCTSKKLLILQQLFLKESLPKGYITEYKNHSDLWIYINKRLDKWLKDNVAPHISISHKLQKIAQMPRWRISGKPGDRLM